MSAYKIKTKDFSGTPFFNVVSVPGASTGISAGESHSHRTLSHMLITSFKN